MPPHAALEDLRRRKISALVAETIPRPADRAFAEALFPALHYKDGQKMRDPVKKADFPILLELEWQDLEGWPSWEAVWAELGPSGYLCEDPWFDLTGWDPARGIPADARLWLERPGGAEGRLGVTPALAAALAEAARGPAQGALMEALLEGLGRSLPS